jgi:prevent-host-death family protein
VYTEGVPKALQVKEPVEVGVRDLRAHLSRWLREVRSGREVIVTDRGEPIARLLAAAERKDPVEDLIARGLASPPLAPAEPIDPRRLPKPSGSVTEIVLAMRDGTWT